MKRKALEKTQLHWNKNPNKRKETKGLFDHLKKESKGDEWFRIKQEELHPYFQANNLFDKCELGLPVCIGSALPLQYAHSKKRGEIALEEPQRGIEMREVIRVCQNCHNHIETLEETDGVSGHQQMYDIVVGVIARRNKRLARWEKVGA